MGESQREESISNCRFKYLRQPERNLRVTHQRQEDSMNEWTRGDMKAAPRPAEGGSGPSQPSPHGQGCQKRKCHYGTPHGGQAPERHSDEDNRLTSAIVNLTQRGP